MTRQPILATGAAAERRAVFGTVLGQIDFRVRVFIPIAIAARPSMPA